MQKKLLIMLLENDMIRLRALEPEDLALLYEWENDTSLWIHGNTLTPYSKLALRQYISDTQQQDIYQAKQLRLMVELKQGEETVGTVDLYDFDFRNNRAGVGILVTEAYRNRGLASQVLEIVHEYAFTFLHIHQLYAYIAVDNEYSIRLFEKMGYKRAGILTGWIHHAPGYKDVYVYQFVP